MPDFVPKALTKSKHPQAHIPHHAPHAWTMPVHEKNCNTQPLINPLCLMSTQQNKYKQYLANFCTMHMLLIPLYCPHSMKFQPGGQTNRKNNESMHTTCGLFIHAS